MDYGLCRFRHFTRDLDLNYFNYELVRLDTITMLNVGKRSRDCCVVV